MKTIEQHNQERLEHYRREKERRSGIECPRCCKELYEPRPGCLLMSSPPQKAMQCSCGFSCNVLA